MINIIIALFVGAIFGFGLAACLSQGSDRQYTREDVDYFIRQRETPVTPKWEGHRNGENIDGVATCGHCDDNIVGTDNWQDNFCNKCGKRVGWK